jgi:hypothetical protein
MSVIRKILGVLVMVAGVLGLALSIAGLVGIWVVKPTVASYVDTTVVTLNGSIATSQNVMEVTEQALGATVDSVNALSTMLGTTAKSVEDTQPVLDQINLLMGETLPSTMESANSSLKTAQEAADVLDSSMKTLDTFRFMLSAMPQMGAFVETPTKAYNPEVPLADSLGDIAAELESLPGIFSEMSVNLDKADDNFVDIQANLVIMSESVGLISESLSEYKTMVAESRSSMQNLSTILTNIQNNQTSILNAAALILSLFFVWLLVIQVVVLTQGWELFQGTAGRMESGVNPASEPEISSAI